MMFWAVNSSNTFDIIKRALIKDPTYIVTTIIINPNFPIEMRINYFYHLKNLQEEALENEIESLNLFLNRPKV